MYKKNKMQQMRKLKWFVFGDQTSCYKCVQEPKLNDYVQFKNMGFA